MKYIIKSPLILFSILIIAAFGYFVGNGISYNFMELYASKLTQSYIRYMLIVIILFNGVLINKYQKCDAIILRRKKYLSLKMHIFIYEIYILTLFFISFNILIFFQNYNCFLENLSMIIKIFGNFLLFSIFVLRIIDIINVFVKNRTISSAVFLVIYGIFDFLLQHINFFFIEKVNFDLSYVFSIPYIYNSYYVYNIIILIFTFFLLFFSVYLELKKDILLENMSDEQ